MKKAKKQVSIKDIAKEAGLSISSVSYAINNKKNVSEDTRKRVMEIVKRLGYRTNTVARSLRTKKTMAIGVIVPDIATPFTSQIVKAMEEVARLRGYTIILGCSFYDLEEEKNQVDVLLSQYIDGIIFFNGFDNQEFVKKTFETKIPLVLIDRENVDARIPSVNVNNIKGMEIAVDFLFSYWHKQIGYITFSFENQTVVKRRYEGYCKGLKKNNLQYIEHFVINEDKFRLNEIDGTYEYMKKYFQSNEIPTSFISFTDYNAYGIYMAARDVGIQIPRHLSVVGYDNIIFSQVIHPPLTSIRQPKKLMGATGMNMLLNIIEGKRLKNKKILLEPNLIERHSVVSPCR